MISRTDKSRETGLNGTGNCALMRLIRYVKSLEWRAFGMRQRRVGFAPNRIIGVAS